MDTDKIGRFVFSPGFAVVAFAVVIVTLVILGCTYLSDNYWSDKEYPVAMTVYHTSSNMIDYWVDETTQVVYMRTRYGGGHRDAITALLNADGTPVTADQLGLNPELAATRIG